MVSNEDEVIPLADYLNGVLRGKNIRAVPCSRGQLAGQDNDVRVFDVQHIKGLEFEAVFFVGLDRLAQRYPDLFEKYQYVGATRAAMFLGMTTTAATLPDKMRASRIISGSNGPSLARAPSPRLQARKDFAAMRRFSLAFAENVGCGFLSLNQLLLYKYSLRFFAP